MSLYVPGYGLMSSEEMAVNAACRKYDNDLVFRRSERTGNFTIFQRLMRDNPYVQKGLDDLEQGNLFPVCAFPGRRMPSVDEVEKWLYQNDEMRQNTMEAVQRRNSKRIDDADKEAREAAHEAALRMKRLAFGSDGFSAPNDGKRRR